MEGSHCYPPNTECNTIEYELPIFEYPNNANYIKTLIGWSQNNLEGCSVTGGYIYKGDKIKNIKNEYFFGDYCTGKIWSFKVSKGKAIQHKEWKVSGINEDLYLSSFGEDGAGEIYLINHTGSIYKIIDAN